MSAFIFFSIVFGFPMIGYLVWRRSFRKRIGFLYLLVLLVAVTWLAMWPTYSVRLDQAKDRDVMINGYILMGWVSAVIGCLPVIILDAVLSVREWYLKSRRPTVTSDEGSQAQ